MQRRFRFVRSFSMALLSSTLFLSAHMLEAQTLAPIELPKPQTSGGKPLLQALSERQTARSIATTPLSRQLLSNLLWAAFGVNRPSDVKAGYGRTAPSALNKQEVQLYVLLSEGVFTYDAIHNTLQPVTANDARSKVGSPAQAAAPVTIVYVADAAADKFSSVDTGFIGQNVYLFATSEGLSAWFHVIRGDDAAKSLNLKPDQHLLYAQAVGYPVTSTSPTAAK